MGKKLVFLIDDEPIVLRALQRVLSRLAVDVRVFEDGGSALEAARTRAPDLVVTDLDIGSGMDGVALARAMRRLGPVRSILVSGSVAAEEVAGTAIREGMLDAFLKKPWDTAQLQSAVSGLLDFALVPTPGPARLAT